MRTKELSREHATCRTPSALSFHTMLARECVKLPAGQVDLRAQVSVEPFGGYETLSLFLTHLLSSYAFKGSDGLRRPCTCL